MDNERKFFRFNPFTHNGFVLGFSVLLALGIWFAMSYSVVSEKSPRHITDIPITVKLSDKADEDGLTIFSQTQYTVDVAVTGNTSVVNKLTADDFVVEAALDPDSTKVTGASLQTQVVSVKAQKAQSLKDFQILSVDPVEITVEYDRVKKITLPIENEIKYETDTGYSASAPSFSESSVIVTGPESVVNKIKRAAVSYEVGGTVKQDVSFKSGIVLYDENNAVLKDSDRMYLSLSTQEINATITVLPKKTVPIELTLLNQPEGFADSRITISPSNTLEIAAPADKLAAINSFVLDTPINFANISSSNNTFTVEIPAVAGVKNISNINAVQVSFNLNGYKEAKFTTSNINLVNVPSGLNPELATKTLSVTVIGSEAQIAKLTGDSLYCTVNMENVTASSGAVEVPVIVQVNGANSCWVIGNQYTVTLNMSAAMPANVAVKPTEEPLVATVISPE